MLDILEYDLREDTHVLTLESLRMEQLIECADTLSQIQRTLPSVVTEDQLYPLNKITMESVGVCLSLERDTNKGMVSKIGEKIVEVFKAIYNAITRFARRAYDFITKLFGGVDKMQKLADSLRTKLNDLNKSDAARQEASISVPRANLLSLDGKVTADTIWNGTEVVFNELFNVKSSQVSMMSVYYQSLDRLFDLKNLTTVDELKSSIEKMQVNVNKVSPAQKKYKINSTVQLPGNRILRMQVTEIGSGSGGQLLIANPRIVSGGESSRQDTVSATIDTPSLNWLSGLLDRIEAYVKQLVKSNHDKAYKDAMKKRQALAKERLKEAEALGQIPPEQAGAISFIHKLYALDFNMGMFSIENYTYSYTRTLLKLVAKCLGAYGADMSAAASASDALALPSPAA